MSKDFDLCDMKASGALLNTGANADVRDRTSSSDIEEKDECNDRQPWSRKAEYILSTIGYCVGLGNVWRFPYICMRNGGGAFFIPFVLSLFLSGLPSYFLEVAMGQFNARSCLHVWEICPLFKGIGYSMNLLGAFVSWYYNMILAWSLIYLVNSFKSPLPWTLCGQEWNTPNCVTPSDRGISTNFTQPALTLAANASSLFGSNANGTGNDPISILVNAGEERLNGSLINGTEMADATSVKTSSAEEFWLHYVQQITSGLDDMGGFNWQMVVALLITNLVILCTIIRGIHSSGKVVYVTATLPYLLITIILINGLTLEGAMDGIVYYIKPDFTKLARYQTWVEASLQVFYSLGPGWGGLLTMASYNKFHNNCQRDSVMLTLICEGTSVLAGFAIFSVLGHMAYNTQVSIDSFASSGAGLAFIVYPEAISYLPVPQLWGILFFIMLFSLGLDSQFATVEVLLTTILDQWPWVHKRRTLVTTLVMAILTLAGLILCTKGGIYVFQLADWYVATFSLVLQCFLEFIVVAWIYGTDRFSRDIEMMIGKKPPVFFVVTWKFISPLTILALFFITLATYKPPVYAGYVYPYAAEVCGWIYSIVPFMSIVVMAVYQILKRKGSFIQVVPAGPSLCWFR